MWISVSANCSYHVRLRFCSYYKVLHSRSVIKLEKIKTCSQSSFVISRQQVTCQEKQLPWLNQASTDVSRSPGCRMFPGVAKLRRHSLPIRSRPSHLAVPGRVITCPHTTFPGHQERKYKLPPSSPNFFFATHEHDRYDKRPPDVIIKLPTFFIRIILLMQLEAVLP